MKTKDEIFYFIDRMILSVCHMAFFGFNSCANLKKKNEGNNFIFIEDIHFSESKKKKKPFPTDCANLSF